MRSVPIHKILFNLNQYLCSTLGILDSSNRYGISNSDLQSTSLRQLLNSIIVGVMSGQQQQKIDPTTGLKERSIHIESLLGLSNMANWAKPKGKDLLARLSPLIDYINGQKSQELWLYNRRMLTGVDSELLAMDQNNNIIYGINFASADYLGLAQNQFAVEAAVQAAKDFGISSSGTPLTLGPTKYYAQLQEQLSDYWQCKGMLIYSAGWLAGFGVIKALVNKNDHIIMDALSHNCLQQGAFASTPNVTRFAHLKHQQMVRILKQTREKDPNNGILVITQGLFSMDSDTPDINLTQQACKQYGAFLLLDCAHDFGCMGDNGRGNWEVQNLKDRSNVVLIGTGSKTLSTNIGFVGCQDPKVTEYLKYKSSAYMHTNALNPVQAATSLANLRILRSQLGRQKRKKVLENYAYLRNKLESKGYKVFGNPCPILPLFVGNEIVCRLVSRLMMDNGVHVNGIQFPVVKVGQARLRVNLMPQHTKAHLDTFVQIFEMSLIKSTDIFEKQLKEYEEKSQTTTSKM